MRAIGRRTILRLLRMNIGLALEATRLLPPPLLLAEQTLRGTIGTPLNMCQGCRLGRILSSRRSAPEQSYSRLGRLPATPPPTEARLSLEPKLLTDHEIRIVRGTYDAMARIGTQQLSLRRIAKELDVTAQLLVYHFGSRDNLLIETMHWALAGTVRRIKRKIAGIQDPQEALAALMEAVFVDPQANRDFHLIYMDLVSYTVRHDSFTALTDLLREHINGSYAAIIQQGVDAQLYAVQDVDIAARQARAIVEGGFLQWLQEPDWRETHAQLQRDCHDALTRLLTASTAPATAV